MFWLATSAGGAATPLIVVPLQQAYGWRAAFFLFDGIGIFWVAAWLYWFRDRPAESPGIFAAEVQIIGEPVRSGHASVPWGIVLRNGNFRKLLLMYHLYCWGAYFYLSWLHTYLVVGRGMTEDAMKVAAALPAIAGAVGVIVGGFLSDRLARLYSLRAARCSIGSVALVASGEFMVTATLIPDNWTAVALLTAGLGVMNAMLPVAWSVCMDLGGEHSGAVSGAMNMAGQAGSFISSVAFGYFITAFGSYDRALMPLALMLILSGAVFATINPGERLIPERKQSREVSV